MELQSSYDIFLEPDAQFPSQGRAFLRKPDEGVAYFAGLLHFAHRHVVVSSGNGHGRDERPFDEGVSVDVGRYVGLDAAFLQIPLYGCQCFTGNNGVFVCPVNQPEYLAHLRDFAFAGYKSYDVDAAVQYRDAGNQPLDARTCAIDVQDGDYYRVLVCGVPD